MRGSKLPQARVVSCADKPLSLVARFVRASWCNSQACWRTPDLFLVFAQYADGISFTQACDRLGRTPLILAAMNGHPEARLRLESQQSVGHYMAQFGQVCKIFIAAGADVEALDRSTTEHVLRDRLVST